jgi:predicted TIM-barrel fold metal-dependent hydrolase
MKTNSDANSGGTAGISRRQWIQMAAGAVSTIPLIKASPIASFAAKASPLAQPVSPTPAMSCHNAHTYMDYEAWRSLKTARRTLEREPVARWDDLSKRAESQVECKSEAYAESSFEDYTRLYMQKMDENGVSIACINTRDRELDGYCKVSYWKTLKRIARVRDSYPGRFILHCGIDPRRGKQGVKLLERAVRELGYSGMGEMLPHLHRFSPADMQLCYPLYEKCAELGLPVTVNTSSSPGTALGFVYNPELFGEVCRDFPTLNICLSGGGMPYWSESVLKLANTQPRVYVNTVGWEPIDEHCIAHYLEFMRRALSSDARRKIMYGGTSKTDKHGYGANDWMSFLVNRAPEFGVEFTEEELRLYFVENFINYISTARG